MKRPKLKAKRSALATDYWNNTETHWYRAELGVTDHERWAGSGHVLGYSQQILFRKWMTWHGGGVGWGADESVFRYTLDCTTAGESLTDVTPKD